MSFLDLSVVIPYLIPLARALITTLKITLLCGGAGMFAGFVLATLSARSWPFRWVVGAYVDVVRGIPILVMLFWVFFCLPRILPIDIDGFTSACIALTVYMSAVTCETFRASLRAIEGDQIDASIALGLSSLQRTVLVVLPQALLHAVPPLLSNLVGLFKESSLVSAVGVVELMFVGQNVSMSIGKPLEILTAVGLIYFVIGFGFTRAVSYLEARIRAKIFS